MCLIRARGLRLWPLVCVLLIGRLCNRASASKPKLRIAGSSTVFPVANAWKTALASEYEYIVQGGGSSTGARRVCEPREHVDHVDIGDMSRNWKSKEATRLDDEYTLECKKEDANGVKNRVTQIQVATDGLAVVTKLNGAGHRCITSPSMGGLTLAQLRWIFSDWSDDTLENDQNGGVSISSVAPNDDGDGVKEWSDLDAGCDEIPINIYGAGDQSGTHDFFAEVVLCTNCFKGKDGYNPEYFPVCDLDAVHKLEQMSHQDAATYVASKRDQLGPKNCYVPSEDDEKILEWVLADEGGIAFFGFAYYSKYAPQLTVVRIASDRINGVQDTEDAKIAPTSYSITDGSYSVFTRLLYMNVDNDAWDLVRKFLEYGFSDAGQTQVADVGYVTVNAAIRAKMISIIARGANPEADFNPVPPSNCNPGTEMTPAPYTNKWGKIKNGFACTACPPGKAKDDDTTRTCSSCLAGFSAGPGAEACDMCNVGFYAEAGASNCTHCPINHIAPQRGAASCSKCAAGMYAADNGSTYCDRCAAGKFRSAHPWDGLCQDCPAGMTTAFMSAEARRDCKCAEGTYLDAGKIDGPCLQCPVSMTCPFGSEYDNFAKRHEPGSIIPLVESGHFSLQSDPLSIYKCVEGRSSCPGGPPQTCSGGHIGLVCAYCPDGEATVEDECRPCDPSVSFMLIFLVIVAVMGIIGAYYFANSAVQVNASVFLACSVGLGILVTANQVLAILSFFPWQAKEMKEFFKGLGLSLGSPKAMSYECLLSSDPKALYIPRCCLPFLTVFVIIIIFFATKGLSKLIERPKVGWNVDKTMNTLGQILQVFYIAIASIVVVPLQCYEHPNGKSSLSEYPQILCWEDDHGPLLAMAVIVAALFLIPFTTWCIYGTCTIVQHEGICERRKLVRFRFLINRFRPECWWWNNACVARQLLLAFTPSLPGGHAHIQAIYMLTVLMVYLTGHCSVWPWKEDLFNKLELAVVLLLAEVVVSGTFTVDSGWASKDFLTGFVFTNITMIYTLLFLFFAYCGWRLCSQREFFPPPLSTPAVKGMDEQQLTDIWVQMCKVCLKMEKPVESVRAMNTYDKKNLQSAMAAWHAVRSDIFPWHSAFRRIGGLPHTATDSAVHAHEERKMSGTSSFDAVLTKLGESQVLAPSEPIDTAAQEAKVLASSEPIDIPGIGDFCEEKPSFPTFLLSPIAVSHERSHVPRFTGMMYSPPGALDGTPITPPVTSRTRALGTLDWVPPSASYTPQASSRTPKPPITPSAHSRPKSSYGVTAAPSSSRTPQASSRTPPMTPSAHPGPKSDRGA